jgi:thiol-disulfide isomerase/thioredoxin
MKKIVRQLIGGALAAASIGANAEPIHSFTPDSMERIEAAQKGKPFVVVIWSLDCEFCRTSLETLAQERRHRPDLTVVTVSTDTVDDPELGPMMRERLAKLGMDHDAWAFGDAPPERLRYAIDRSWHGEKPRSYWFDGKGDRTAYSGLITPEIIKAKLERKP